MYVHISNNNNNRQNIIIGTISIDNFLFFWFFTSSWHNFLFYCFISIVLLTKYACFVFGCLSFLFFYHFLSIKYTYFPKYFLLWALPLPFFWFGFRFLFTLSWFGDFLFVFDLFLLLFLFWILFQFINLRFSFEFLNSFSKLSVCIR